MNTKNIKMKSGSTWLQTAVLAISLTTFNACTYDFPEIVPEEVVADVGGADFGKYVSIGNSITAGFMDGALYNEGQQGAFPVLLHRKMQDMAPDARDFFIPNVVSNTEIGYSTEIPGLGTLGRLRFDDPSLSPVYDPAIPAENDCSSDAFTPKPMISDITAEQYFQRVGANTNLNNFAVPGITLGQFLSDGTGTPGNAEFNPYFYRFATRPGINSLLDDVLDAKPTFFTFWLGNNDILNYAYNGGTVPFTDPATFATQYRAAILSLVQTGAKGVAANIPNVVQTPYFSAITEQVASTTFSLSEAEAAQLNGAYALQGHPNVNFGTEGNQLLIETQNGTIRQFIPGEDFITLSLALDGRTNELGTAPIIACGQQIGQGTGMGIANFQSLVETPAGPVPAAFPIPNRYVLDREEVAQTIQVVDSYNEAIATVLTDPMLYNNVALLDIHEAFHTIATSGVRNRQGLTVMNGGFTAGGGFSTDGIHPNPKGQAHLANLFAEAINQRFGSNLQMYDITLFRGNEFPVE